MDATQLADPELKLRGLDDQARYLPTRFNSRRWAQEQSTQRVMPGLEINPCNQRTFG